MLALASWTVSRKLLQNLHEKSPLLRTCEQRSDLRFSNAKDRQSSPKLHLVGSLIVLHVNKSKTTTLSVHRVPHNSGQSHVTILLEFSLHLLQGSPDVNDIYCRANQSKQETDSSRNDTHRVYEIFCVRAFKIT